MLTVNPALAALNAAGELPILQHNRFVVLLGAGSLHVLNVGYVGSVQSASAPPETVLVVASPNLLAAPPADSPLAYELTYALRRAQRQKCEEELLCAGVLEVPTVDAPAS